MARSTPAVIAAMCSGSSWRCMVEADLWLCCVYTPSGADWLTLMLVSLGSPERRMAGRFDNASSAVRVSPDPPNPQPTSR